jgi:hypothetical protein
MIGPLKKCALELGLIFALKDIGGLGIRNLQAGNQGLILSAAWRLAKEPHSLLAQILKAKKHHDCPQKVSS